VRALTSAVFEDAAMKREMIQRSEARWRVGDCSTTITHAKGLGLANSRRCYTRSTIGRDSRE